MQHLKSLARKIMENFSGTKRATDAVEVSVNKQRRHPLSKYSAHYTDEDVSFFMQRGRFRPLALSVETVNICNNDCIICPYSAQTRPRRTMPLALFEKVVSDYADIGGGHISLTPLVGEAFLDKHLLERLRMLSKQKLISSVSVSTNATMAKRYDDDELSEILSRLNRVVVSVYGINREEFMVLTRKDHYDQFYESLVRIVRLAPSGCVVLGIRHLADHSKEAIEEWAARVAKDAGVSGLPILSIHREFANWSYFDTTKPLPMGATWRPTPSNTAQCGVPLLGLEVMSDGRVSFCACANFDGADRLLVGDITKSSFIEILDSKEFAELWDWEKCGVPEFCKTCSFHFPLDTMARLDSIYRNPLCYIGG
ncbi:MAG TPA: radical SAM protein [Methylocystis sp.]|jgi:MoaA/NifB/PqqE/SkfB family radical SAM enzyme